MINAPDTKIYDQHTSIELHCQNIDPDYPSTDTYHFSLYGQPLDHRNGELTLEHFHVKDENGIEAYRKIKGRSVPVYNIPKGMNVLTKRRKERHWSSALWLAPSIVSDMASLLLSKNNIYVACHVKIIERDQWLIGFDMQTNNPLD